MYLWPTQTFLCWLVTTEALSSPFKSVPRRESGDKEAFTKKNYVKHFPEQLDDNERSLSGLLNIDTELVIRCGWVVVEAFLCCIAES